MRLCVIDGQGGGLGKRLVQGLLVHLSKSDELIALGTNEAATKAMQLAGANQSGTGEQQITRTVPTVDVILASLNFVLPGAMLGEVTSGMPPPFLMLRGASCCCRLTVCEWKSWGPKLLHSKT